MCDGEDGSAVFCVVLKMFGSQISTDTLTASFVATVIHPHATTALISHCELEIDRCLANGNVIGDSHDYIVTNKIAWWDATIAWPVVSGSVSCRIDLYRFI